MAISVSLIISTYKQESELSCILKNLAFQTWKDFEVIVAEDNDSEAVRKIVESFRSELNIQVVQQQDLGFRKSACLNNAIRASSGDYLIFNDGDCVPHTHFIESHMSLAEEGKFLSGRRVMLGPEFTKKMLSSELNIQKVQKTYFLDLAKHLIDKTDYYEEGLFIDPSGLWRKLFAPRPMRDVLGANFSFYKKDIEAINGFDQDYVTYGVEDNDLLWRLKAIGVELKSARNAAITYHLGKHEKGKGEHLVEANRELMRLKQQRAEFVCRNGLRDLREQ